MRLGDKKYVQIALDYVDLDKAVSLINQVLDLLDNVIIEIGTPLVKSNGVPRCVKTVRELVGGDALILVDMKTMDAGFIEAEMVFSSGGNITTVLGVADDETIKEAIRASRAYGGLVQADLINHPDPVGRAGELVAAGVHIIGLHAGIDVQRGRRLRAVDLMERISGLRETVGDRALISVAGGIKPSETGALFKAGADIVVIGAGITSSPSPRESLMQALKGLPTAV